MHNNVAIIGGGISGLSALHYVRMRRPNLSVTLYEKDIRLGGTVGTDHVDGYSFDWGPNGFLDREPLTLELAEELGLGESLERANEAVQKRFILRRGVLRSVPMSPPAFIKSDILSWPGKLRVMMEPFGSKRPEGVDESIFDFARRRIGKEAAEYLVQPMVSGVYGGLADRLSLKSTFKIMHEMESEYGSLIKAMISKAKKAKKEGRSGGGPSGPGGWLTSFKGGLYEIIERMHEIYDTHVITGSGVEKITRTDNTYSIELLDGTTATADHVILATPSFNAAEITKPLSDKLAGALAAIDYAPIAVVCFGYSDSRIGRSLDGFGFLVPRKENLRILGSIWTSSIFEDRAPDGKVQLRTMVGGDGDHDVMNLTDGELIDVVKRDLRGPMQINGDPEVVKIYRWSRGIPQFKIGHADRMAAIETELAELGNIAVTGNAYYGIGLNDCVKQSHHVVQQLPE